MANWLAFVIWLGGVGMAYRRNRARGVGRFGSAFEALAWPCGVGYRLARDYYVNADWDAPARREEAP